MTFPAYEDFKAPWEEKGEEPDPEKVKRLIYNARKDEEAAVEKAKKASAEVTEHKEALKTYRSAEADAKKANETETETLKRELKEAKEALEKGPKQTRTELLLEVALDQGLTKAQAKRLVGDTLEELTADAVEYKKDLPDTKVEEGDLEDNDGLRREPQITKTSVQKHASSDDKMQKHLEARRSVNSLIA